jgi:hypothetical protein
MYFLFLALLSVIYFCTAILDILENCSTTTDKARKRKYRYLFPFSSFSDPFLYNIIIIEIVSYTNITGCVLGHNPLFKIA